MEKIEKVIKALECCKSPNDHEHCPYNTGVHYNVCTYRLLSDMLELLKDYAKEQKNTDTLYQRIKRRWAMRRQRADATDEELKFLVELLDWMEAEDEDDEA